MLINEKRELAYTVRIDAIEPIIGSDNCEAAVVGGWRVMTRKGTFKPGDIAVYFEIDSKLPETYWSKFLEKKHYIVKTQKYTFGGKGNFVSQGLLIPFSDFFYNEGDPAWLVEFNTNFDMRLINSNNEEKEKIYEEMIHYPLTELLGVTYAIPEDNKRKSSIDKYDRMRQRHFKLFKENKIVRWLFKKTWGKKLLFIFLGKKRDGRNWPAWVKKTDEERIENLPFMFENKEPWVATEKIDGTSTTFTMRRKSFSKNEFYICSRNVVFDKPEKECFYETNVYIEIAEKYHVKEVLREILNNHKDLDFVTLQGETYGAGIQKREYSIADHDFMAFNLIFGYKDGKVERFNPIIMTRILSNYNIPCVPILDENYILPDTLEELRAFVDSEGSKLDGEIKEGIVFRSLDGERSFKCVSPEFLIKYHD